MLSSLSHISQLTISSPTRLWRTAGECLHSKVGAIVVVSAHIALAQASRQVPVQPVVAMVPGGVASCCNGISMLTLTIN